MHARTHTKLVVGATLAGGVVLVLAAAMSVRRCSRGETVTLASVPGDSAGPELDLVVDEGREARTSQDPAERFEFVSEPVFGDQMTILATDANGQPVPDAVLQIFEPAQAEWDLEDPMTPFERDPLGEVRRLGTTVKCDASGRARIPRPQRRVAVLGSTETLAGFDSIWPLQTSPWFLDMRPQHTLEVRVRDENGVPIAGLGLDVHESDKDPLWRGVTDANGRATIDSLSFGLNWPDDVVVLTAGVPVDPPVERWLPSDLASPSVVELVIPAGATTIVRIVDLGGRVLDVSDELTVYIPREGPRARCETNSVLVPVIHGCATIRGIPASCNELDVTHPLAYETITRLPSGLWPSTFDLIAGGEDHALVRFAVRDADGKPLSKRVLEWGQDDVEDGEIDDSLDGKGVTDALGEMAFHVYFPDDTEGAPTPNVIEIVDTSARPPLRGAVDVEQLRSGRLREPVVVTMTPVPIALSGRVTDESGSPLVNAAVQPRERVGCDTRALRTFTDEVTDTRGRFEIFALPTKRVLGLNVLVENRYVCAESPDTPYEFGTKGIELHARLPANIEGRLLVDPACRDLFFDIAAVHDGEEHGDFDSWSDGAGIHWRVTNLEAGTYDLRVSADHNVVCTIEGVDVPRSCFVHDPRCLPIDLRGRVPFAVPDPNAPDPIRALHIVDERGLPIEHGVWRYESDGYWFSWRPFMGGELTVLEPFENIAVWSPGRFVRAGPAPQLETTWKLEPAKAVDVKFEIPRELRSSTLRYVAKAQLTWDTQRELDHVFGEYESDATLDEAGRTKFGFPAGGNWEIEVCARWDEGGDLQECRLQTFAVRPEALPGWETAVFTPDAANWLKELREREAPIPPSRD